MHATIFFFKGTVSFQFAAVRFPYVATENSLVFYQLRVFTIRLISQLHDRGHNGFTHSQCTNLQSKEGETLYTNIFKTFNFQIHSRVLWLLIIIIVKPCICIRTEPLNTTDQLLSCSGFVRPHLFCIQVCGSQSPQKGCVSTFSYIQISKSLNLSSSTFFPF